MKYALILYAFSLVATFHLNASAQDTLITDKFYRHKAGLKIISEISGDYNLSSNGYRVYSHGIQYICQIKSTRSSIESGIYKNTKAEFFSVHIPPSFFSSGGILRTQVKMHYIGIPVLYRIDTKFVYFTAGILCDFLTGRSSEYPELLSIYYDFPTDKKIITSGMVSLGIEKPVNSVFSLFVEGRFATTIFSRKVERPHFSFTNSGFGFGLNFKINNKREST